MTDKETDPRGRCYWPNLQDQSITDWHIEKGNVGHGRTWSIRVVVHFKLNHLPYYWKAPIMVESTDKLTNLKNKCKEHLLAIFPNEQDVRRG